MPMTFASQADTIADFSEEFNFVVEAAKFSAQHQQSLGEELQKANSGDVRKVCGVVTNLEFRFASIDSAVLKQKAYLRLKNMDTTLASSDLFESIVFLPNSEGPDSLVILVPRENARISANFSQVVKEQLASMNVIQENAEDTRIWLPRFRQEVQ